MTDGGYDTQVRGIWPQLFRELVVELKTKPRISVSQGLFTRVFWVSEPASHISEITERKWIRQGLDT